MLDEPCVSIWREVHCICWQAPSALMKFVVEMYWLLRNECLAWLVDGTLA